MSSFGQKSLQVHLWILFVFVIIKCILDFNILKMHQYSLFFVFFFSVWFFFYLFVQNIELTKDELICGKLNTRLAFFSTVFPYVFIYLVGMSIIYLFPGWLRSFSNTFGLTIVRMCGYNLTVNNIFKGTDETRDTGHNLLKQLYNDPDKFINELDVNDVKFIAEENDQEKITWDSLDKVKASVEPKDKKELIGYLNIKDSIATYIWVGMLSTLTILISQNRLLAENCTSITNDKNMNKFQQYLATELKN